MSPIASAFSTAPSATFLPHGYCIAWDPELLTLHVASDATIALSYYSIPLTLIYFLARRPLAGHNWVLGLFAAFILACGTTHLMAILTLWEPVYWAEAWIKVATAAVSISAALVLWPLAPRMLALPTPAQLQSANRQLRSEIDTRLGVEAELREFQAQLEQNVRVRTADLERAKLDLQKEVEERMRLDRFKDELLSMVSHELRTPLTSIGGSLHLLTSDHSVTREEQRELADIALRNTQRMIRLVHSLLDIDRIESGRIEFGTAALSLAALAKMAVLDNQTFARQYDVRLVLAQLGGPVNTLGDSDRLMQVMTNLIANAVRFAPRGSAVTVNVTTRGDVARISIADRGPGIPAEYRARIFEKFVQVPHGNVSATDGLGLGLSIARAIVDRHGGTIGIDAPPEGGSEFYFELPLRSGPPTEANGNRAGGTRSAGEAEGASRRQG